MSLDYIMEKIDDRLLKVTLKGALRIKGYETHLFKDGSANYYHLEPITEELTERLLLKKKIQALATFDGWSKLEEPVINKIYELIPGI